ncbi:MAG: hypothetical protein WC136_00800 [Sphaerochaeta sp.]|jgi:hypothetical protein
MSIQNFEITTKTIIEALLNRSLPITAVDSLKLQDLSVSELFTTFANAYNLTVKSQQLNYVKNNDQIVLNQALPSNILNIYFEDVGELQTNTIDLSPETLNILPTTGSIIVTYLSYNKEL